MHNFEIIVQFGTNTVELGYCDADYISIITLLHCMSKKTIGKEDVPKEQFCVFVILPWCNDVVEVKNDNELVNVFSMFREYGCSRIVFEIDYQPYVPLPPEGSSCTPNAVDPEVLIDEYEGLDVDDLDENYFTYHGDDEDGGSVNGEEGVGFHVVMQWLLLAIILMKLSFSLTAIFYFPDGFSLCFFIVFGPMVFIGSARWPWPDGFHHVFSHGGPMVFIMPTRCFWPDEFGGPMVFLYVFSSFLARWFSLEKPSGRPDENHRAKTMKKHKEKPSGQGHRADPMKTIGPKMHIDLFR
ncbi:hypothetical protein ACOSQ2_026982 [Xanthoceras sorbifolium]